jgi:cell division septal protein FtsQ
MVHLRAKLNKGKGKKKKQDADSKSFKPFPYKKAIFAFTAVLIVAIIFASFYSLYIKSPYFIVMEVMMAGGRPDTTVNYSDLERMIVGQNIFKLDLAEIRDHMLDSYKELFDLRLNRAFPGSIVAVITLRKPVAQVHQGSYYPVDEDGVVLSGVKDSPDKELPIIRGIRSNLSKQLGKISDSKRIKNALLLIKELSSSGILNEHTLVEVDSSSSRNTIFFLEDGLEVKIGREQYASRLQSLKQVLHDPKLKAGDIRYIDLRFKEPVIGPRWKR